MFASVTYLSRAYHCVDLSDCRAYRLFDQTDYRVLHLFGLSGTRAYFRVGRSCVQFGLFADYLRILYVFHLHWLLALAL